MCLGKDVLGKGRQDIAAYYVTLSPHTPIVIALVAACPFAQQKANSMYIAVAALDTRMRRTYHPGQSVKPVQWDPSVPVHDKYVPKVNASNDEHHPYLVGC